MKSYSTYIFDWDGCLAKTLDIWLSVFHELLGKRNIKVGDKEITALFGDWDAASKLGVVDVDRFKADMKKNLLAKMPTVDLYPHAFQTLKKLHKRGNQISMLSSSVRQYIDQAMALHHIELFFDLIVTGEELIERKPHPEGINKIITSLNADPKTTVMIGDSDKDIEAAHNAGIDSILFYPPQHALFYQLNDLKKSDPTFVVSDHQELIL